MATPKLRRGLVAKKKINLWKEGHLKVSVVQATGTGKSYLIGKVSEGFANFRVLTLAPRTHILNNRGVISKNKSLKDWIARQRQAYRKGRLSEYKLEKLKSIGFMFEVA